MLVTGGTGFIGSRLIPLLSGNGTEVRVLALRRDDWEENNLESLEASGVDVRIGSVTDPEAVHAALEGMDAVIHLAAAQSDMSDSDDHFRAVNVGGVSLLLQASAEAGIRRFVHASTVGVYGDPESTVDENSPTHPTNIYGTTKLEGERVVRTWDQGPERVILRLPETYGPGDRRLLKLFGPVKRGRFPMVGPGENLHQPIFVDDLAPLMQMALESPAAVDELFLIGGPRSITSNEMVQAVADAVGGPPPRIRLPMAPMAGLAVIMERTLRPLGIRPPLHTRRLDFYRKSFSIDASKAQDVLGYAPTTDFRAGAQATARWYEDHGLI